MFINTHLIFLCDVLIYFSRLLGRVLELRTLTLHIYWLADISVSAKRAFLLGHITHLNPCVPVGGKHHTDNSNPVLDDGNFHPR